MILLADGNFDRMLEMLATLRCGQTLGQDAYLENSLLFHAE